MKYLKDPVYLDGSGVLLAGALLLSQPTVGKRIFSDVLF